MYVQENLVTITKAANGFIVVLPIPEREQEPILDMKQFGDVIKSVLGDSGDELLNKLRGGEESKPLIPAAPKKPESNVHVFKTFEEVIEFLEYHFRD